MLEDKIYMDPNSGCWIWEGTVAFRNGKVRSLFFTKNNKQIVVSRFLFERQFGEIPDGMILFRECGCEYCVNVSHYRLGFQAETANRVRDESNLLVFERKTMCVAGHPFPENLRVDKKGRRECLLCRRCRRTEYKRKRRMTDRRQR